MVPALAAMLTGCVTAVPLRNVPTVDELSAYAAPGDRSIAGQAFLRQGGGGVVTCAGEDAVLLPAVPLVEEAMRLWLAGEEVDASTVPRANVAGSVRWSTCDAAGNFAFAELPARIYWLVVPVRWSVAREPQGGMLARRISLEGELEPRVILSGSDRSRLGAKPWLITDHLN